MPDDMDVSQSAAEKFSALLRPIKDAALAFDVDVNEALEEYVEECVRYVVAESDDVINFAEAGLLLQGSALVFGRKVDGLHALVYKVLENLKTGKQTRVRPAGYVDPKSYAVLRPQRTLSCATSAAPCATRASTFRKRASAVSAASS